ncbi:transposase [Liquorilactobacillus ghanensis]|uniref:transposase n=1 Tax=Liquorilactobacillus ghanensis TaxID=399370 RepID=UPI0012EE37A1
MQTFHQLIIKKNYVFLFLNTTYLPLRRYTVQKEAVYITLRITVVGIKEILDLLMKVLKSCRK